MIARWHVPFACANENAGLLVARHRKIPSLILDRVGCWDKCLCRAKIAAQKEKHRCVFGEGAVHITMKRCECGRSESMKIDRRMRALAGSRRAMKLLFAIVSSGIEKS